jgi:hypothetical protein
MTPSINIIIIIIIDPQSNTFILIFFIPFNYC